MTEIILTIFTFVAIFAGAVGFFAFVDLAKEAFKR